MRGNVQKDKNIEMRNFSSLNFASVGDISLNPDAIPKGDMPGDKISIGPDHIKKAQFIMTKLSDILVPLLNNHPHQRAVIAVYGGSGVGKSEVASLLSYYLNSMGVGSYTLSGDNYPHRTPFYNDSERLRVFRQSGLKGLLTSGQYSESMHSVLLELQKTGNDSDTSLVSEHPWLGIYQEAGKSGLRSYLGTTNEINFDELTGIISQFKNGADSIFLKRMGRELTELWYDPVDFREKHVLIIEWTHGNSYHLQGVDIPVLLNSTPQETLAHRSKRNRDGGTDSSFTTMVLSIEQDLLMSQAPKAKLIISKNGDLLSYDELLKVLIQEQSGGANNEQ